jgi:hypothetical protein
MEDGKQYAYTRPDYLRILEKADKFVDKKKFLSKFLYLG